eukprot:368261-Amphidinium_carterae.1
MVSSWRGLCAFAPLGLSCKQERTCSGKRYWSQCMVHRGALCAWIVVEMKCSCPWSTFDRQWRFWSFVVYDEPASTSAIRDHLCPSVCWQHFPNHDCVTEKHSDMLAATTDTTARTASDTCHAGAAWELELQCGHWRFVR